MTSPTSSDITRTEATLGGTVVNEGAAAVIERGVVFSKTSENPDPLIGGAGVTQLSSSGNTEAFTVPVNSLIPGTEYTFKAYATNSLGTGYTASASFSTTNQAPTFAGYTIGVDYEASSLISKAKVLTAASDPDGDAFSITAVGASANNGTALLQANTIDDTAPDGFSGNDTFPVTISDAYGASGVGTVTVTVSDSATTDIHTAIPTSGGPVTGTFQPDARTEDPLLIVDTDPRTAYLATFVGLDPNGSWTLFIADQSAGAVSTIDSWSLSMTVVPEPSTSELLSLVVFAAIARRRR